jgi:type II secretory pathway pseudopilin PulG
MRKSTRLGFKLIELVLVIGLIAILAMIVLPGVLKIRSDQARLQTNNNLRQCALAIHKYHDVYHKLPDAAWTGGSYANPGEERSMWFHLLPFVEQESVYKNNVHNAVVPAYLAPSDPSTWNVEGKISFAGNIRLFGYASLGAAKANSAVNLANGNPSGVSLRTDLAAAMQSKLPLARIPDGTSNVFMLATRYLDCGSPASSTYYSASPIGTVLAGGGTTPSVGAPTGPAKGAFFGAGSHHLPADSTSADATFQTAPRVQQCVTDDSVFGHSYGAGGMSMALADASIFSVDPNISPTFFCRALCPSDGYLWREWPDDGP